MPEWVKHLNLSNILISAAIIAGAVVLWAFIRRAAKRVTAAKGVAAHGTTRTAISIGYDVLRLVLIVAVILTVLQINGINVTSLVAGLGIAGGIVGLAFQDFLKDVIMGFHIVTDDFFKVGDVIVYGGVEGQVISFNVRTTKFRDLEQGNIVTVCNRNISEIKKRSNLVTMNVPLSYEEDYRKVHEVLRDICEKIDRVEGMDGCVYKGTQDFADSAVIYRLNLYCPPEKKWEMWRAARALLQEGLAEAGIAIPYQQLDVHLDK